VMPSKEESVVDTLSRGLNMHWKKHLLSSIVKRRKNEKANNDRKSSQFDYVPHQ